MCTSCEYHPAAARPGQVQSFLWVRSRNRFVPQNPHLLRQHFELCRITIQNAGSRDVLGDASSIVFVVVCAIHGHKARVAPFRNLQKGITCWPRRTSAEAPGPSHFKALCLLLEASDSCQILLVTPTLGSMF